MIKLENIHTDAELLSVFKRLADRFVERAEELELEHLYDGEVIPHSEWAQVEQQVLEEFVAQENVLELPPPYPIQEEVYPIDHETLSLIRELQRSK